MIKKCHFFQQIAQALIFFLLPRCLRLQFLQLNPGTFGQAVQGFLKATGLASLDQAEKRARAERRRAKQQGS